MRHMPNLSRRLTSIFLALVLAFILTGVPAAARTLDEINRDIENTQKTRDELARQGKDVTAQLGDVEKSIATIQNDISTLEDQLKLVQDAKTSAEADLIQLQAKLQSTENDLAEQGDVIDTRLSSIYKSGDLGYVEVILGAKSFDDFINRMNYLAMIVKSDKQVFDRINVLKSEIQVDRDVADAKKQEILSREDAILKIKQPLDYRKAELDQQRGNKEYLLDQISTDVAAKDETIRQLIAEEQAAAGRRVGGGERPGYFLCWPAGGPGYITSEYGYRIHPIFEDIRFHYGIDIGVEEGTPCVAPAPGTVIYVGWSDAVGNTVEIDHGGGVKTRYCHLLTGSTWVYEGSYVAAGQQFARTGNTGYLSSGGHLHFEVFDFILSNNDAVPPYNTYQRAYTVDPLGWLP